MCGLLAVFSNTVVYNGEQIYRALQPLSHRGPDGEGFWSSGDGRAWLAHKRLSIIDLEGGQQPLLSDDGEIACIVNGEFYNYLEIKDDLIRRNYRFLTQSDSEILIGLYQEFGVYCLEYLRGEFSFVLYDKRKNLIFSARDRFGIKPLFYYWTDGCLCFASEVKAFKALGLPIDWNPHTFLQEISFLHAPASSLFNNIHELPPGHYGLAYLDDLQFSTHLYWNLHFPTIAEQGSIVFDEKEVISEVRERFSESIKLRLKADVPVACYLSGGIDASSVLGIAQGMVDKPIDAFTLSFDHPAYDESSNAKSMTDYLGSNYHPVEIGCDTLISCFEDTAYTGEKMFFNGNAITKYVLSRVVREHGYKVVITGDGADEVFSGYGWFRQDFIENYLDTIPKKEKQAILQKLQSGDPVSEGVFMASTRMHQSQVVKSALGFFPNWMQSFMDMGTKIFPLFCEDYAKYIQHLQPAETLLQHLGGAFSVKNRSILSKSLYTFTKSMLPHYVLTMMGDRTEMAHSIEGRLPFLDHHLVEYVSVLPDKYKIRGLTEKYILREAMKPVLTEQVYKKQKQPLWTPPLTDKKNRKLHEYMKDIVHSRATLDMPFLDHKKAIRFFEKSDSLLQADQNVVDAVKYLIVSGILLHKRLIMS
ncbi:asparagine synthase (glutamine-hydrolyzing) [Microbulbifer sp. SSSA008]|uniref:asparagine synthase (glutamine-hydrolyzing) n=1 Tax=Microbulbifer sp. SSSA008 TaxID=3243380 RepID=UPI00403969FC